MVPVMLPSYITRYWGKAQPPEGSEERYHPLAYHCLDVAAVAVETLRQSPVMLGRLCALSGLNEDDAIRWAALMIAWHDMGKFAHAFQSCAPSVRQELYPGAPTMPYVGRHDGFGVVMLQGVVCGALDLDPVAIESWVIAVTGHHGKPPDVDFRRVPANDEDVIEWARESFRAIWGRPAMPSLDRARARRCSWLVAGLTVSSDWIGSDTRHFPYRRPEWSVADYFYNVAIPTARRAVRAAGVTETKPAPHAFDPFPYITHPTPLQQLARDVELPIGPQLWIFEEVTGGGKTEAAMTLAARMVRGGLGAGIYVALPTMATANAMHGRLGRQGEGFYGSLYGRGGSMVLAHGKARVAEKMARAGREYASGEETASTTAASWLRYTPRAALLATLGVGTIDQAMLAVIAAKFQSIRLLGVSRSILIVDEVHACDAYMNGILRELLRFHAALGGSAILLSATLPRSTREGLAAAFKSGLQLPVRARGVSSPKPATLCASMAFPLVTSVSTVGVAETHVECRVSQARPVTLSRVPSVDEATQRVIEMAASGKCVAWIRNTVVDAIESYKVLRDHVDATLFHARYAFGDRRRIERDIIRDFGPASGSARAGRVVVATQVIEQSLDVDFDEMVTDLAPIDLLIQRAGRLHRHARGERGDPTLHVISPDPADVSDDRWLRRVLPKTEGVYQDLGALWRTARWIFAAGRIEIPRESRDAIEAVYGCEDAPPCFSYKVDKSIGDTLSKKSIAAASSLRVEAGYSGSTQSWLPDDVALTRLGYPTVSVILTIERDGELSPMFDGEAAWQLSELRVAQHMLASGESGARADRVREAMGGYGKDAVIVALREIDVGRYAGKGFNESGRAVEIAYTSQTGLEVTK